MPLKNISPGAYFRNFTVPLENAVSYLWDFTEFYPTLTSSLEELTGLMFIQCSHVVGDTSLIEIGDFLWVGLANKERSQFSLSKNILL